MSLQDNLVSLYMIDQKVRSLTAGLDSASRRLAAQERKLGVLTQQRDELDAQAKRTRASASSLEHQARDAEERIESLRAKANSATNDREYRAMLGEMANLKEVKGKLETQSLGEMEKQETLDRELTELQTKVEDQQKLVNRSKAEVVKSKEAVGDQLTEAQQKRNAAAALVPRDVLVMFDKMALAYEGEALAEVIEEDRRNMEYACGGCYMSIPVERLNSLMTRHDVMVICPNCSRILCEAGKLHDQAAES